MEVVVDVGLVVGDAVRPTEIPRGARAVDLVISARSTCSAPRQGIGTDVANVEPTSLGIDRDAERIAQAHRVDLRPAPAVRKQVVGGNAVATGGKRCDAEDLAAQVHAVGRRSLGIELRAPGALIDRRVALGVEWVRVIPGGDVEVSSGAEGKRTRLVATAAVRADREQQVLRSWLKLPPRSQ